MQEQVLNRLVDGFDEFRERLTRIEEGVKPIADIKKDVDQLKVEFSRIDQSAKSAHKRLDGIDKEDFSKQLTELKNMVIPIVESEAEKKRDIKLLKNTVITSAATGVVGIIIGIITAFVKGWL